MIIKGNKLLIDKKARYTDKSNILDYQPEFEQRANEGVIIAVGEDVTDPHYAIGETVHFPGFEATEVHDTNYYLISAESIMAVGEIKKNEQTKEEKDDKNI